MRNHQSSINELEFLETHLRLVSTEFSLKLTVSILFRSIDWLLYSRRINARSYVSWSC